MIAWDEARIAEEIRHLHTDEAWVDPDPARGHWSLAGAQGKLALARTTDGWAEPSGAEPSTHILKVGIHHLKQSDIAEFVTMRAAARVGVETAECELALFEDQPAVIVTRYDRVRDQGRVIRIHQEDLCQILAVPPDRKYQSDGGPSWSQCLDVIRRHLVGPMHDDALQQLLRWQVFNLLTASTDGHAKNLSILIDGSDRLMAPAYDLISVALLSDPRHVEQTSKLAMSFGKSYDVRNWDGFRLERAAEESGLDLGTIATEVARQSDLLDDAITAAMNEAEAVVPDLDLGLMRERWAARAQRIAAYKP